MTFPMQSLMKRWGMGWARPASIAGKVSGETEVPWLGTQFGKMGQKVFERRCALEEKNGP